MIALVWCTDTGWNARFDQFEPDLTIDVPVTIAGQPQEEMSFQGDFHALKKTLCYRPVGLDYLQPSYFSAAEPTYYDLQDDLIPLDVWANLWEQASDIVDLVSMEHTINLERQAEMRNDLISLLPTGDNLQIAAAMHEQYGVPYDLALEVLEIIA